MADRVIFVCTLLLAGIYFYGTFIDRFAFEVFLCFKKQSCFVKNVVGGSGPVNGGNVFFGSCIGLRPVGVEHMRSNIQVFYGRIHQSNFSS